MNPTQSVLAESTGQLLRTRLVVFPPAWLSSRLVSFRFVPSRRVGYAPSGTYDSPESSRKNQENPPSRKQNKTPQSTTERHSFATVVSSACADSPARQQFQTRAAFDAKASQNEPCSCSGIGPLRPAWSLCSLPGALVRSFVPTRNKRSRWNRQSLP